MARQRRRKTSPPSKYWECLSSITIPWSASSKTSTPSTPDRGRKHHRWRFNDGKADKEDRVVNHLYVRAGTFPAELTVTDSAGNQDRTEIDVVVRDNVSPPSGGGGGGGPDLRVNVSRSPSGTVPAGSNIDFIISVNYSTGTASTSR